MCLAQQVQGGSCPPCSPASYGSCKIDAWIMERLERKLADAIGSSIVEKCDVIIGSHSTSYIRCFARLTFHRIFHISAFDYTDCPCFELKDEEDLLLEKTVRWYKTGRGKRQSK